MSAIKGYIMIKTSGGALLPAYPKVYANEIDGLAALVPASEAPMRRTMSSFNSTNPVLEDGQLGIVTDYSNRVKIGDGTSAWNELEYIK